VNSPRTQDILGVRTLRNALGDSADSAHAQLPVNADYFLDMNIKLAPAWRQVVSREYRVHRANSGHFLHSGSRIPVILVIHGGKKTIPDRCQTLFLPSNCRSHLRRRGSSFLLSQAPGKRILFAWWAEG
jgi:hypothetical protein